MSVFRLEPLDDVELVAPVVVAAFDGWVDAAGASSAAAEHLARGGELIATFDADILFDFRSRRPVLDIIDGTLQRLEWPSLELHRIRAGDRDVLVLHGAEPDFRWRELGDDLLELSLRLGVVEWVSLGAIPAAVPHTRAVPVMSTASDDDLLKDGEIKGPPGLLRVPSACLSAVELTVAGAGVPTVGYYAQVPHYVGGPYAAGTVALLERLSRHLHVDVPMGSFAEDAATQRERLDVAVEADDDVRQLLERLEGGGDEELPSGDELAAEIERFLRDRPGDGGPMPGPGAG
ncbi:MAG TPA: PAC2 family protein [Actinomycetota bacterium]|nr:PAC2 family protein [Actinomycetota bacterium]